MEYECEKQYDSKHESYQHKKWICPKCGYEIKNSREKHLRSCNGQGPRRKRPPKRGTVESKLKFSENTKKLWNNDEYRNKIINGIKKAYLDGKCSGRANDPQRETERRLKISCSMKNNSLCGGLRHGSGRGKKGWYKGYWCDSTWELAYVIYCLEHGITIERNKQGFEYFYEGKIHKYYPDFILEDGSYVEIKGYLTEQFKTKINQFHDKLIVIGKKEINIYIDYVVNTYGKNFESLYDGGIT